MFVLLPLNYGGDTDSALWRQATSEIPGSTQNPQPRPGKPRGLLDSANTYIFNEPWTQLNCISALSAARVWLDLGVESAALVLQRWGTFSVVCKLLLLHPPSPDQGNVLFRHEQTRKAAAQCEWIITGLQMQGRKYPRAARDSQRTQTSADGPHSVAY